MHSASDASQAFQHILFLQHCHADNAALTTGSLTFAVPLRGHLSTVAPEDLPHGVIVVLETVGTHLRHRRGWREGAASIRSHA